MTPTQAVVLLVALSVPVASVLVVGRLLWSALRCLRAARLREMLLSVLAALLLLACFIAVLIVWFGYGMAHTVKDVGSDLRLALVTVLPFHLIAYALWRTAGRFIQGIAGPNA